VVVISGGECMTVRSRAGPCASSFGLDARTAGVPAGRSRPTLTASMKRDNAGAVLVLETLSRVALV
jgi:hypothetical protein